MWSYTYAKLGRLTVIPRSSWNGVLGIFRSETKRVAWPESSVRETCLGTIVAVIVPMFLPLLEEWVGGDSPYREFPGAMSGLPSLSKAMLIIGGFGL